VGGSPDRTDPGGPGLDEFGDTPWLAQAEYTRHVLASIPAPVRSARLMLLEPGTRVPEHDEPLYGLQFGGVRLHVPVITNPEAMVVVGGEAHHWEPGSVWYGDFSRPHSVRNNGQTPRVHLVVDCHVTLKLLSLFPDSFRSLVPWSDVVLSRPPIPLQRFEGRHFCRDFRVPAWFSEWPGAGDLNRWEAGRIGDDDGLVLSIGGRPRFRLTHLGNDEFRLAGWTEERTLHIDSDNPEPTVTFRRRVGRRVRESSSAIRPVPEW
jgi:quercetin dioxygenase-like cupin family protein